MTDSFGILRKIQKYVFHDMLKIFLTMHCHKKNWQYKTTNIYNSSGMIFLSAQNLSGWISLLKGNDNHITSRRDHNFQIKKNKAKCSIRMIFTA